ncbi:MAG: hypothetical protein JWO85_2654 [Candidatus Eremiobacteraeota bacterium]|nr:hypothetical protein [Candidatus Eremiobacteraeota bacterium]
MMTLYLGQPERDDAHEREQTRVPKPNLCTICHMNPALPPRVTCTKCRPGRPPRRESTGGVLGAYVSAATLKWVTARARALRCTPGAVLDDLVAAEQTRERRRKTGA